MDSEADRERLDSFWTTERRPINNLPAPFPAGGYPPELCIDTYSDDEDRPDFFHPNGIPDNLRHLRAASPPPLVRRAALNPAAAASADFTDEAAEDAAPRSYYALSSAFFGVEYDSRLDAWIATYYTADGRRVFGGSYDNEEAAALGYNACLEAARLRYKKNDVGDDGRPLKPSRSSPFYGVTSTPAHDGSTSGWKAQVKTYKRWGFDIRRTENLGYYDRPCEGSAALAVDAFLRREAPPDVAAREYPAFFRRPPADVRVRATVGKVNFPTAEELLMCAAPGDPPPAPVAVPPRLCVFFEVTTGVSKRRDSGLYFVFETTRPHF